MSAHCDLLPRNGSCDCAVDECPEVGAIGKLIGDLRRGP